MRAWWALVLVLPMALPAQQRIDRSLIIVRPDTATQLVGQEVDPSTIRGERSTGIAILLSAVLPGAGQVYTHRWVSIPIIWGFGAYFGKQAYDLNKLKQEYEGRYGASVRADTVNHTGDLQLKEIRNFYRDERDKFTIYLGLTYLMNLVDAYVGAALYGFDVAPQLDGHTRLIYRVHLLQPNIRQK